MELEAEEANLESLKTWAAVTEREEAAKLKEQQIEAANTDAVAASDKIEELQAAKVELTKRREELERELQDLEEVFYRTAKEGEKYANESKDYKKRLRKLNSEEAVYRDGAERARGNVEKWRLDIENEEAGLQAKEKAIHETAQRKLASLQADLRASEEQLHDLEAGVVEIENNQHRANASAEEARKLHGQREKRLGEAKKEAKAHKEAAGNKAKMLHNHMPKLLDVLAKNAARCAKQLVNHIVYLSCERSMASQMSIALSGSFKEPPVGPLGMMLQLHKEHVHLGEAAEKALHSKVGLSSFIVHSMEDEKTFRMLMNKYLKQEFGTYNLKIIVRKKEPRFNIVRPDVGAVPLLIDLFNIENDAVFNVLCDSYKAFRTCIFADVAQGKDVMFGKLRHVRTLQAFAGNGKSIFTLAVKGSTELMEPKQPAVGLLHDDSSKFIQLAENTVSEMEVALTEAIAEARRTRSEWEQAKLAESQHKKGIKDLEKQVPRVEVITSSL
ncbi:MAG: hypothetical protein SGPRY_014214 [Prymnesium sp.]